jgi:hypothetical protein
MRHVAGGLRLDASDELQEARLPSVVIVGDPRVYLSVGLCVDKVGFLVVEVLLTGKPVVAEVLLTGRAMPRFPRVVVVLNDYLMCGTMSSKIVWLFRDAGARVSLSVVDSCLYSVDTLNAVHDREYIRREGRGLLRRLLLSQVPCAADTARAGRRIR